MKNKKLRILGGILVASMAATMALSLAACQETPDGGDDVNGGNGGNGGGTTETLVHSVSIIGLKTQTVKVNDGETLESYKPATNPKKSGEKFVGWFEDGSTTEYDWKMPITKKTTIRAKFEKIEGLAIPSGTAFPLDDGGYTTGSDNTLYLEGSFTQGSFSVDVTPTNDNNDCGVVFGVAESASSVWWEDNKYFTVLINKEGIVFLSGIPWTVLGESNSMQDGYDKSETYTITVKYSGDGYAECYVNDVLLISNEIGELYGTGVGCRAQASGTVFGKMTFDPTDIPVRPSKDVGGYVVRNGRIENAEAGAVKTVEGSTLAIVKDKQMQGAISLTMKRPSAGTCDGIVFGLTDNDNNNYWENNGVSYYFLFIGEGGEAGLSKVAPGWTPFDPRVTIPQADEYRLEVVLSGGRYYCFVNGVKVYEIENELDGTAYGIRSQKVGVEYTENDLSGKCTVIVESTGAALQIVDAGSAAVKPADPEKGGFIFDDWYVGDSATAYDWTAPVTENIIITAKFTENVEVKYTVPYGGAEKTEYGYKTTAGNTLIMMKETFSQGSVEAKIKPNAANDCALIFGAAEVGTTWENFDYYMVMINSGGIVFLAKTNGWAVLESSSVIQSGFDPALEHTVKAVYGDGFVQVYIDGTKVITSYIGQLKGSGIGFRAALAGTEFGEMTVDATAQTGIGAASTDVGTLTKHNGASDLSLDNGIYTTTCNDTLATSSVTLANGGCVSVTMTMVAGNDRCHGVVFGLNSEGKDNFWEGEISGYYFFFIDTAGTVRLARTNGWGEPFNRINSAKVDIAQPHKLTVSWDGNGVTCFVDGVMYFAGDQAKFSGAEFGIRAQDAGVTYTDFEIVSYAEPAQDL